MVAAGAGVVGFEAVGFQFLVVGLLEGHFVFDGEPVGVVGAHFDALDG